MKDFMPFRQNKLSRRLAWLISLVSLAAVTVSLCSFVVLEGLSHRRVLIDEVASIAAIIGDSCRAALVFGDTDAARNTLESLRSSATIHAAWLIDKDAVPLVYFDATTQQKNLTTTIVDDLKRRLLADPDLDALAQRDSFIYYYRPIRLDGDRIGGLILQVSSQRLAYQWRSMLLLGATIAVIAMGMAILLALRHRRIVSGPIEELSHAMAQVTQGNDFDLRLPRQSDDELGNLIDGFNAMLGRIATHERKLEEINASLEERVLSRTAELGRSELRYRSLFESSPISLWEEDFSAVTTYLRELGSRGVSDFPAYFHEHPEAVAICAGLVRIVDINTRTLALYRASDPETLLDGLDRILTARSFDTFTQGLVAVAMGETNYSFETTNRTLEGEELDVALHFAVVPGHEHDYGRVVISIEDITTRKTLERELRASLKEKDLLLQEVHHRVKNNLQIISSLISLQIKNLGDAQVTSELHSTLLRVRSMALIHERLYRSLPGNIALEDFIGELSREIIGLYGEDTNRVTLQLAIEPIPLTVDQGMTFAIIINELLTNALKYAFPAGRRGQVSINLQQISNDIVLNVQDNGIGLPADFDPKQQKSLGYRLLLNLAEQVQGTLNITGNENGTCVTLRIQNHRRQGTAN